VPQASTRTALVTSYHLKINLIYFALKYVALQILHILTQTDELLCHVFLFS
jgi:hypothetical protein